jgi:hypothetical protein
MVGRGSVIAYAQVAWKFFDALGTCQQFVVLYSPREARQISFHQQSAALASGECRQLIVNDSAVPARLVREPRPKQKGDEKRRLRRSNGQAFWAGDRWQNSLSKSSKR